MLPFDPYLNWLGIPPHEQPPSFYRLLGVVLFESNPEVIQQAADRQSLHVGAYQSGPQGEICQQLLSEIAMAQFCLLDPHQKAAYDGQLYESLAQRGERAVAAPPPPASMTGTRQFYSPSPQYGPQSGMSGPPQPMQAQPVMQMPVMQAQPVMQMPPMQAQPVMQMPVNRMSAPPGFVQAVPHPLAPAAMPVAAPFPIATAVFTGPAAAPTAPPAIPPVAPQRPIDELESLTSEPTTRRRILKRNRKVDHTKEIIIGSVVTVAGVLLFVAYFAIKSHDPSGHGFDGMKTEKPVESVRTKHAEEMKQKEKEIKEKKDLKKNAAAAHTSVRGGKTASGNVANWPRERSPATDDITSPNNFGPPTRTMDSPDPGGPAASAPQFDGHDTPRDLGSEKDPVMDTQN
ncbi:MAG: hypothetical protein WCJ35_22395 [Planctomycetota bacterium]